jgi:hypothetical protein
MGFINVYKPYLRTINKNGSEIMVHGLISDDLLIFITRLFAIRMSEMSEISFTYYSAGEKHVWSTWDL